jgi:hypothetical protein
LVPAEVPKGLLVESLPFAMVTGLRRHNGAHPRPEQIRLRMALHAGEVCYDEHGVTGASVNLAFRLLEADPLKRALAGSPGVLAVIASSWFFEEVARHTDVAGEYRRVDVAVKETTTTGWICLPDGAATVPRPRPRRTWGPRRWLGPEHHGSFGKIESSFFPNEPVVLRLRLPC